MFYTVGIAFNLCFFLTKEFQFSADSVPYDSFLYSHIPWIIIFDVDVYIFRSEMFSPTYLAVRNDDVSPQWHTEGGGFGGGNKPPPPPEIPKF
jgi:hypothetical protein